MDSYTNDGITVGDGRWEWEWDWNCFIPREGANRGGGGDCMYEDGELFEMPKRGEGRFIGGEGEGEEFQVGVPLYFVVTVRVRERLEGGALGEVVTEGRFEKLFSVVEQPNNAQEEDPVLVLDENQWICDDGTVGYSVFFSFFFSFSFFYFFYFFFFFFICLFVFHFKFFFFRLRCIHPIPGLILQNFRIYGLK